MADEKRTALYVRIPQGHADKLDRVAFELKVSKQDLITGLVEDMKIAPGFTRRRTEIVEVDDAMSVGRASVLSGGPPEVLKLREAADLLQTERDVVQEMASNGDLPGRLVGDDWRFSRVALLRWLGTSDSNSNSTSEVD
jgi:excisionase family DNA binding protein